MLPVRDEKTGRFRKAVQGMDYPNPAQLAAPALNWPPFAPVPEETKPLCDAYIAAILAILALVSFAVGTFIGYTLHAP